MILRLEMEKKTAIEEMMGNITMALQEKDEAVATSKRIAEENEKMKEEMKTSELLLEEMRREKDEISQEMEQAVLDAEQKREEELAKLKAQYAEVADAEDKERSNLISELQRGKSEAVALMQKEREEKLAEIKGLQVREMNRGK